MCVCLRSIGKDTIPKSKNVPLQSIEKALSVVKSKNSPVFVYCHSGARSRQAVGALQKMGYENVKNIAGLPHIQERWNVK